MTRFESEINRKFIEEMERAFSGRSVQEKLFLCRKVLLRCRLCSARSNGEPVPSYGDVKSKLLILDSNPGLNQERSGEALDWRSPTIKLLSRMMSLSGEALQKCFVDYVYRCRTKNRTVINYDKCSMWLAYELWLLKDLKAILTLGESAYSCVLGDMEPSMDLSYGAVKQISLFGRSIDVYFIKHPWYIMKHGEWLSRSSEVVAEAMRVLK